MSTTAIYEIAPDLFRLSIYVPDFDMQFNRFLVRDEEPLLFHAGLKGMFAALREAVAKIIEPAKLRSLADLKPETLAVMHGSSYRDKCDGLLTGLAGVIKETFDH